MKKFVLILCLLVGLVSGARGAFAVALMEIAFDSGSGTLVGISIEQGGYKFVSINPAAGLLTVIRSDAGSLHGAGATSDYRSSCVDPTNHIFYSIYNDNGTGYVISINASTGTFTQSPALHF